MELSKVTEDLFSDDQKERIQASAYINRVSRGNWTQNNKEWLTDQRVIGSLLKSLCDDEEKVLLNSINTLGMISQRYDYDVPEILDSLLNTYENTDSDRVKISIAQAIPQYNSEIGWKIILEVLSCKPHKLSIWTVGLAVARYGETMQIATKDRFIQPLIDAFYATKNDDSKRIVIKSLAKIGGKSIEDGLDRMLKDTDDPYLRDSINACISTIRNRN